jgi:MoaA/NifB/PqqE/SkfB family radical SAM enzyme
MARPLTLLIDITERCNLRCVMCHFARVDRIRFPPFDRLAEDNGNMPVALFEKIASELFPRAASTSLGCASEPLMHPHFAEIVSIAGRHAVPDLWFPTNLLPLTAPVAQAIVRSGVRTVAVSIDGVRPQTYERIRAGATWDRLMGALELLRSAFGGVRRPPRLRVIFTWMQANRDELPLLPSFAASLGAQELDVRYVAPAVGVDISKMRLDGSEALAEDLAATARDAVRRGLRLAGFPQFGERPSSLFRRIAWRLWRIRAGIDRFDAPPDQLVIRPTGAIFPCQHSDTVIGFAGLESLTAMCRGAGSACAICRSGSDTLYNLAS